MKVSELNETALDWAVAKCEANPHADNPEGFLQRYQRASFCRFSNDWSLGGVIIEREWLDITPWPNDSREDMRWHCQQHDTANDCAQYGETPLVAAMRCYVASKLGDDLEIPEELQ